jgi:hypothetical protein
MPTATTQAPTPGQPIPTPPDFPVAWDDPRDAKLTWMRNDKYKAPIPPLIHAVVAAFLVGNNPGFERASLPFCVRVARLNTYQYFGWRPRPRRRRR